MGALQDDLQAKLTSAMKTLSSYDDSKAPAAMVPSMWCGSLIMQAVVGDFAAELEQHYQDPKNTLELSLDGNVLRFAPKPSTTTTSTTTTSTTTTSTTTTMGEAIPQNEAAVNDDNSDDVGVLTAVTAVILIVVLVVV